MITAKKLLGARSAVIGVGACLALGVSACALSSAPDRADEEGDSVEPVGEAQQADHSTKVYTQNGFKITWTYVSTPSLARKIAACSGGRIFVQNSDYSVYYSMASGVGGTWNYSGHPAEAREIACTGDRSLVALNADKSVWRTTTDTFGLITGWYWSGLASQAEHIASGSGQVYALNFNKAIFSNDANGANGSWTFRQNANDADRVTGAASTAGAGRSFALNVDKSLWYNDGLLASPAQAWHPLNNGGLTLLEISAAAPDVLYGLTTTYELWQATFADESCMDGTDDDRDGLVDGVEDLCMDTLGVPFCATHPDGYYCTSAYTTLASTVGVVLCDHHEAGFGSFNCLCYPGSGGTATATYCPPDH